MKTKKSPYLKPKISVKKIKLNLFFTNPSYLGDEGTFLASCWTSDCSPCGPGCGSDCAC